MIDEDNTFQLKLLYSSIKTVVVF